MKIHSDRSTSITLNPPSTPLNGTSMVPGSKSFTNRSLLIGSLSRGLVRLENASQSTDSLAMIEGLAALGVSVHHPGGERLIVDSRAGRFLPYEGTIDVGAAGTTMRFLTALIATIPGTNVLLKGSERMHTRPIGPLVEALRSLGANISYEGSEGSPPLRIRGCKLHGGTISISGAVSSQFISSLLLVSPYLSGGVKIMITEGLVSSSYLDMTIENMASFGVTVSHPDDRIFEVAPDQSYRGRSYQIEGDYSGASYLWGLAAIGKGRITVSNVTAESRQGDALFPDLLERMGCRVTRDTRGITVEGPQQLKGITADMTLLPDTAQTLAVIASCASDKTVITGLQTLRGKETDRLLALNTELAKVGIHSEFTDDSITVYPGTLTKAAIDTYEDHRMAMSFAMLGAAVPGIVINDPKVVEKSYPRFWDELQALGMGVTQS